MEQADPSQYETRLAVCKACKWLNKAENVVLMWKREPFGQMHIARWGQTYGDHQIRSLYHISISLFIKLANPLFQSLFACFTILFAR